MRHVRVPVAIAIGVAVSLSAVAAWNTGTSASVAVSSQDVKARAPKPVTMVGTLVDTKCYSMDSSNRNDDHKTADGPIEGCAAACAKMGIPVGLLNAKGRVIILLAPAPSFEAHMGQKARVRGVSVLGGAALRVSKVEVQAQDGAWTALDLHEMM